MKSRIVVTIGDFNGIGPELALKVVMHPAVRKICTPLLVGPLGVFQHVQSQLKLKGTLQKVAAILPKGNIIPVYDVGDGIWADVQFGKATKSGGKSAGVALETAVNLCLSGKAEAMVTSPVSKEALHLAGYNFPGQTEMVALFSHSQQVAMMLVSGTMRIGLVTIHVPLKAVAERITMEKVQEKIQVIHHSLSTDFGITEPRMAVLGLNPHAGENGVIGDEELKSIIPAIDALKTRGMNIEGPFAPDSFFGKKSYEHYDVTVAMYHDQGLIPLKMSSFGKAVNFSAGLAVVRTSPDHGTGYDIAGKGIARTDSMIEAVKLATHIVQQRHD